MKIWPTVISLILGALAVAAIIHVERGGGAFLAPPEQSSRPLLPDGEFPVAAMDRITLQRADQPPVVFERAKEGWVQVEPFHHPMDRFSIHRLAQLAGELTIEDRVEPDESAETSAATFSLDPPEGRIVYEWPEGSLTLLLGRRSVAGRAYLRLAGDETIYIVDQSLHDRALEMDVREWRDRRIYLLAGVESDCFIRREGAYRLVLERERKTWRIIEPVQTRLDPAARDELFDGLGRATIGGFILDQPDEASLAKFGLADPVASIEVTTTRPVLEGEEITRVTTTERLFVGSTVGVGSMERFGMVEGRPVVVKLTVPVLQALFKPPRMLVDPTACDVDPADVKSIVLRTADMQWELRRELERWVAPEQGPDGGDAEVHGAYVEELLRQLTEVRAPSVEIRPYPREMEVATITLHGHGRKPLETVRIVRDDQIGQWALENGDDVLRIYPDNFTIRLTPVDFGLQALSTQ